MTENRGQYQGLSEDSKAKEVIEVESVKTILSCFKIEIQQKLF